MGELYLGTSGWNYPEPPPNGWLGVFYPTRKTKMLQHYSQFFNTAEMDSTFYEKLYSNMTKGTFIGISKAVPEGFLFSLKLPETVTHKKRLDARKGAFDDFQEFIDKISPLKTTNKLGALLIQLPPSFGVSEFRNVQSFLERLPSNYDYAIEFRHGSWQTEGPWELLKHYNISAVITDCPDPKLQFLSEISVTAENSFIRWHGRGKESWYYYYYKKEEFVPWLDKVKKIVEETKKTYGYFNNHFSAWAVANCLQFTEMIGRINEEQKKVLKSVEMVLSGKAPTLDQYH